MGANKLDDLQSEDRFLGKDEINGLHDLGFNKKAFDFKIFSKSFSFLKTATSMKMICFRVFIFFKKRWQRFVKNIVNSNGKRHFFLVFLLGFCNFAATTPFSIILILPLTFGSLLYIVESRNKNSVRSLLLTVFAFLFGYFTSIFWWFFVPLTTDFLHLFWLTPFAIFGLPCIMSLLFVPFFAIGLLIWKKLSLKKNASVDGFSELLLIIIFLSCWLAGDYIRGHFVFGGFPWMLFGHFVPYAFAIQLVKFIGIDLYSMCFLALVLTPYLFLFKRQKPVLQNFCLAVVFIWIVNCLFGVLLLVTKPVDKVNVNIFASQANMPATYYINNDIAMRTINKNAKILSIFSHTSHPALMIMPEGSINYNLDSGNMLARQLGRLVPNDMSLLLAGGVDMHGVAPYNVIYAINNDGHIVDMYKKQKLVPFGEYIPFRRFLPRLTRSITGDSFDFATDGANNLFIFHKNLPIIYPIICYESIFPEYVERNIAISRERIINDLTDDYAKQVNVKTLKERGEIIVNLTNDAWMKWSVAPYQHFLMARFLAVSTGLPVIRVSNNGISAFIDSRGRIKARTVLNQEDLLLIGKAKFKNNK